MRISNIFAAVIVLFLVTHCLQAQRFDDGQMEQRAQNRFINIEGFTLFGDDSVQSTLHLHYRVAQNFFIFIRNDAEKNQTEYRARGELVVELIDEKKTSVGRRTQQIGFSRSTMPKEGELLADVQGVMPFSLGQGTYQLVVTLEDRESGRAMIDRDQKIVIPRRAPSVLLTSPLLMAVERRDASSSRLYTIINRGGNILFGSKNMALIQLEYAFGSEQPSVNCRLEGKLEGFGNRKQSLRISDATVIPGILSLKQSSETVQYSIRTGTGSNNILAIPLPTEKLEPGTFTLTVEYRSGSLKKEQIYQFRVLWPNRPVSLMNHDLAIDALTPIATKEELDLMQSGSETKRSEAFVKFWKNHDRDTSTAYNEVMAEYYFRVDEAIRKYSSSRAGDGYRTDRGRIYILFGQPTTNNRILAPGNSPTEVWVYEPLKRRFIFIDQNRSGNYVLSQADSL